MPNISRGLCFFALWTAAWSWAAMPKFVGSLTFDAPIVGAKVSVDGRLLVVKTQQEPAGEIRLSVFELTDGVARYEQRGALAVEGTGALSLSPDGKRALLVVMPEQEKRGKTMSGAVLDIDLSRPNAPVQAQRWGFVGRRVVLAPDASSYAVSAPAQKEERWQTLVYARAEDWNPILVEEDQFAELKKISASGRYVVYSKFGQELESIDLSNKPPPRYVQTYAFIQRHDCVLTILSGGQIVVEDARIDRIAVYAPGENLPRVGILQHEDGKYCYLLNPNVESDNLIVTSEQGELAIIDFRRPETPVIRNVWQLPTSFYHLAATTQIVYTVRADAPNELHLLQLNAVSDAKFDWGAFDNHHRNVLAKYQADVKAKRPSPYYDVVNKLEQAGVLHALNEDPAGISPHRVAAIFNDYGFLAAKTSDRKAIAERALKRAIALDSKRAVAYLNLADLQRNSISTINNWTDKTARWREATKNYRKYFALGGKTNEKISAFLRGDLQTGKSADFCGAIANYANADRLSELVSKFGTSLPLGNRKVDLFFSTQGTANFAVIYAFDSKTDELLDEDENIPMPPDAEGPVGGGDKLALLVYRNGPHILYYSDLRHPVSSVSLLDGSTCVFKADVKVTVGSNALEPELCRRLQEGNRPEGFKFDGPVWITHHEISERWPETSMLGTRAIDFANNGKPINVAQMEIVSGAGAGCTETFYELVDRNATQFAEGSMRDLLMKLQRAEPSNRYPILPCGNVSSFFRFNDKTYFENKPASWPPMDTWNQYYRVVRVDDSQVVDVCQFKFQTRITGHGGARSRPKREFDE